jgi:hypothetical protein
MSMAPRRCAVRKLALEWLSPREMLAGDVTATLQGQMLVITGDDAANGVVLTYDTATHSYQVRGSDAGGSPTTINGQDTSQPGNVPTFANVKSVYVGLGKGDDSFQTGSPEATDVVIAKWMSIEMGEGNDQVVLGQAGNGAGGSAPVARSLQVGTGLRIDLGDGNDQLDLANARIGQRLQIFAGSGDDLIRFPTEFTPTGQTTPQVFPVQVRDNVFISLGSGEDVLQMQNVSIRRNLKIEDGAGSADITLNNVQASKRIDIHTANDPDEVSLTWVRAKQLAMSTNGGLDQVALNHARFTTLNVKLGSASDRLTLNDTRTSFAAHLNGDQDGAVLLGTGNKLRGLWRRNFG